MRKVLTLFMSMTLFSCAVAEKGSDQSLFSWQIFCENVSVVASISDNKTITHYDGSSEVVTITDSADSGHVYVLIQLKISKSGIGGPAFEWKKLTLVDREGTAYARIDDSFLSDHDYDPLPSISLRLGNNEGWIGFEIPQSVSKGKLFLTYAADEGQNKIIVKP